MSSEQENEPTSDSNEAIRPVNFDGGSFRDRSARVFQSHGNVYRTLTHESCANWQRVSIESFFQRLTAAGKIVQTVELTADESNVFAFSQDVAAVLRHEKIPFITYPYEWSFAMLRSAALLQLEIVTEAVRAGWMLKDASPFNIQFVGTNPVFIDIASFIELPPDEPWLAYRQFCELMLFPLLLQAYRGVDFQPLLRAQLEGISARQFMQWMRWRDLIRPGVFTNGWLHAALEKRMQAATNSTVRQLQSSGFQSQMIDRILGKLTRTIERLTWTPEPNQWANYDNSFSHVADDGLTKSEFVRTVCSSQRRQLVWDLGCNDGRYSTIAAEYAKTVVAMDRDHPCIDQLFNSPRTTQSNILPLCIDVANASPAQGWRGRERTRLEDRGRPELVLCLGLIHHLVFASNIPLPEVVDWLASLGGDIVLEFPTKNDSMVRALLRNKRDQYDDYSLGNLEAALERHFTVRQRKVLPSGERTLFHAVPKFPVVGAV